MKGDRVEIVVDVGDGVQRVVAVVEHPLDRGPD